MMDEGVISDVWILFKDAIDKSVKESVAEQYIDILIDHGASDDAIRSCLGTEEVLDKAIHYYLDSEEDEEEDW